MWLTLIEPADDPSYDARTFECLDCNHSEIVLVEIKAPDGTSLPRHAA
jgi:transcription elongation factor Elf1